MFYDYDGLGRLKTLLHTTATSSSLPQGEGWGEGALSGYKYTYDAASRVMSIDSKLDGLTSYNYDYTNQLVSADHATQNDETYSYDANGNRTGGGYQTGTNNRLLNDGTYEYQYDADGNRISRTRIANNEITAYEYDHRNRLVEVGANYGVRHTDWDWGEASGGGWVSTTS